MSTLAFLLLCSGGAGATRLERQRSRPLVRRSGRRADTDGAGAATAHVSALLEWSYSALLFRWAWLACLARILCGPIVTPVVRRPGLCDAALALLSAFW